ncbi:3'-5' exonuclease [Butyrivibrio sp. NC3005]|uniref:3'-5' exonuclease n=1 Tax=Butyrivibrio sp. NC3005 TaxID=1280685 RepID=UPI00041888B3|nr:3'-5' exonuclease [Butyrivibrio sp. NC3005]
MSNYIVFDLEWNQGGTVREQELKELPFEIVEIGAVRLNEKREITGTFSRLIHPQVYHKMHQITGKLINLSMEDLENGDPFEVVINDFLEWCGDDPVFCSWGTLDLPELQRNMDYYKMESLSDGPIEFLDVQKLFSLSFEDGKSRRALEYAIDFMEFEKKYPFHRALSDAQYTAEILQRVPEKYMKYVSFDSYVTPKDKRQEIHIVFDNYAKYISREFSQKEELLEDVEVTSTRCYLCHKNIRRKIRWFSPNGKHYYALSLCDKHGYMKSKIRIKKSEDGGYYAIKTSKFVTEDEVEEIREKQLKTRKRIRHLKQTDNKNKRK